MQKSPSGIPKSRVTNKSTWFQIVQTARSTLMELNNMGAGELQALFVNVCAGLNLSCDSSQLPLVATTCAWTMCCCPQNWTNLVCSLAFHGAIQNGFGCQTQSSYQISTSKFDQKRFETWNNTTNSNNKRWYKILRRFKMLQRVPSAGAGPPLYAPRKGWIWRWQNLWSWGCNTGCPLLGRFVDNQIGVTLDVTGDAMCGFAGNIRSWKLSNVFHNWALF